MSSVSGDCTFSQPTATVLDTSATVGAAGVGTGRATAGTLAAAGAVGAAGAALVTGLLSGGGASGERGNVAVTAGGVGVAGAAAACAGASESPVLTFPTSQIVPVTTISATAAIAIRWGIEPGTVTSARLGVCGVEIG